MGQLRHKLEKGPGRPRYLNGTTVSVTLAQIQLNSFSHHELIAIEGRWRDANLRLPFLRAELQIPGGGISAAI